MANLGSSGDDDDVGHVWGQLGKEGDGDGLTNPAADVLHEGCILAASQAHSSLT